MTRKHFEALAKALREVGTQDIGAVAYSQWALDVATIADVCERFNPQFDRERFIKACNS